MFGGWKEGEWSLTRVMFTAAALLTVWTGGRAILVDTPLIACGPFPDPSQTELPRPRQLSAPAGYRIEATHEYSVEALVTSVRRYSGDREAELSPVDLALAWGPLTTQTALDQISYSQSGRWYHYRWPDSSALPVSPGEIVASSANTHLVIPYDRQDLQDFARTVRRGDIVRLSGYLVQVKADDGWRWNSSRTRTDSGAGSCEVVYVTSAAVVSP